MNTITLKKIEGAAAFLSTQSALIARPYLDEPYQMAFSALDAMRDGVPRSCQEIADLMPSKPSYQSINQLLMALDKGGIVFVRSEGNPTARKWSLPKGRIELRGAKRGD